MSEDATHAPSPEPGLLADLPEHIALASAETGPFTYEQLIDRLSRGLTEIGLPVWRTCLGVETLHPVESGRTVTWSDGEIVTFHRAREGVMEAEAYLNSPVWIVDETGEPLRIRLTETDLEMPTILEMRAGGGTDYYIAPLPFYDDARTAVISFATRAEGGFSDRDLAALAAAVAVISPHIERLAIREIAVNLLETYVGPRSGQRVFQGLIDRGDLTTVSAAILFADLRNYTILSERLPAAETVSLLDTWFDTLGGPIEAQGGEILKFLGDGLLAVFPGDGTPARACRSALNAARETAEAFARVPEAIGLAADEIGFGIGLHYGELGYGNVGSRHRLDFTVIGPAVNLASRLQDLSKSRPEMILASEAFARCVGPNRLTETLVPDYLVPVGDYELRGIADPVSVYAVPVPDTS